MTIHRIAVDSPIREINGEHTNILINYGRRTPDHSRILIEQSIDDLYSIWARSQIVRARRAGALQTNELRDGLNEVVAFLRIENFTASREFSYMPCFILDEVQTGSIKKKLYAGIKIAVGGGAIFGMDVAANIVANIAAPHVQTFITETFHTQSMFSQQLEALARTPDERVGLITSEKLVTLCHELATTDSSVSVSVRGGTLNANSHISAAEAAKALPGHSKVYRVAVEKLKQQPPTPGEPGQEGDEYGSDGGIKP